ncbi:hypothetical protein BASA62_000565 [Batrachochytrium salamandrivorans]|nr:hypothetical protein BASA62_000565 [Batrachochytrium salamandrivorans]
MERLVRLSTGSELIDTIEQMYAIEQPNGAHVWLLRARYSISGRGRCGDGPSVQMIREKGGKEKKPTQSVLSGLVMIVADADGPPYNKRNNDKKPEEPEEQAQTPKVSSDPDSGKRSVHAYDNPVFEDDFHSTPNTSDDTQEDPTNAPIYVPNQDDKGKGARQKAYAGPCFWPEGD